MATSASRPSSSDSRSRPSATWSCWRSVAGALSPDFGVAAAALGFAAVALCAAFIIAAAIRQPLLMRTLLKIARVDVFSAPSRQLEYPRGDMIVNFARELGHEMRDGETAAQFAKRVFGVDAVSFPEAGEASPAFLQRPQERAHMRAEQTVRVLPGGSLAVVFAGQSAGMSADERKPVSLGHQTSIPALSTSRTGPSDRPPH